jgi:hypothetical protein
MENTHNQEFLHLQDESKQSKEDIQIFTFEIASNNTRLETLETKVIGELVDVKGELASLTQWLKQSHGSPSLEQPYHFEGENSSYNMVFHSNSLPRDPRLSLVEVNKFDGSDPIGWVTQMELYFSLHGITGDLTKLHYGVLYLDSEC